MKKAYGLDLAGYSGTKSALAEAIRTRMGYSITVFKKHPFNSALAGDQSIVETIQICRQFIKRLTPLYVDVPIDLQGLPFVRTPLFTWQLIQRPVDHAFGGMSPVASWLGSPVTRMASLLDKSLRGLERTIFETYPKASLELMLKGKFSYKRSPVIYRNGIWHPKGQSNGLAELMKRMSIKSKDGCEINDDEFDAAICALTGVVGPGLVIRKLELEREIRRRLADKLDRAGADAIRIRAPKGYELIKRLPGLRVTIEVKESHV